MQKNNLSTNIHTKFKRMKNPMDIFNRGDVKYRRKSRVGCFRLKASLQHVCA